MQSTRHEVARMLHSHTRSFLPISSETSAGDSESDVTQTHFTADELDKIPIRVLQSSFANPVPAPASRITSPKSIMYTNTSFLEPELFTYSTEDESDFCEEREIGPREPIAHVSGMRYYTHALSEAERESLRRGGRTRKWAMADVMLKAYGSPDLKEQWMIQEELECARSRPLLKSPSPPSQAQSLDIKKTRRRPNLSISSLSSTTMAPAKMNNRKPSPLREETSSELPRAVATATFDDYLLPAPTMEEPDAYSLSKREDWFDKHDSFDGKRSRKSKEGSPKSASHMRSESIAGSIGPGLRKTWSEGTIAMKLRKGRDRS